MSNPLQSHVDDAARLIAAEIDKQLLKEYQEAAKLPSLKAPSHMMDAFSYMQGGNTANTMTAAKDQAMEGKIHRIMQALEAVSSAPRAPMHRTQHEARAQIIKRWRPDTSPRYGWKGHIALKHLTELETELLTPETIDACFYFDAPDAFFKTFNGSEFPSIQTRFDPLTGGRTNNFVGDNVIPASAVPPQRGEAVYTQDGKVLARVTVPDVCLHEDGHGARFSTRVTRGDGTTYRHRVTVRRQLLHDNSLGMKAQYVDKDDPGLGYMLALSVFARLVEE